MDELKSLFNKSRSWVRRRIVDGEFQDKISGNLNAPKKYAYHGKNYTISDLTILFRKSRDWVERRISGSDFSPHTSDREKFYKDSGKCFYQDKEYDIENLSKKIRLPESVITSQLIKGDFTHNAGGDYILMEGQYYLLPEIVEMKKLPKQQILKRVANAKYTENLDETERPEKVEQFYYNGKLTDFSSLGESLELTRNQMEKRIRDCVFYEHEQDGRNEKFIYKDNTYYVNYEDELFEVTVLANLLNEDIDYILENTEDYVLNHKIDLSSERRVIRRLNSKAVEKKKSPGPEFTHKEALRLRNLEISENTIGNKISRQVETRQMTDYEKKLYGLA